VGFRRTDPENLSLLNVSFPQLSTSVSALTEKWPFLAAFVGVTHFEQRVRTERFLCCHLGTGTKTIL
jgi:hypothetical protein